MENNFEKIYAEEAIIATSLPDHILKNLKSPLLRAGWLMELDPEFRDGAKESSAQRN